MNSNIVIGIIAVIGVIGAIVLFSGTANDGAIEPATPDPADTPETVTPEPNQPDQPAPTGNSIVDLTIAESELSTLVTAVSEAGLVDVLSTEGPFTVFAPTNDAFAALPAGALDELLLPENNEALQNVLASHVVLGTVNAADLSDGMTITTLNEQELTVTITDDGEVFIGGSQVIQADIDADNGVIHVIDTVILDGA